MATVKPMIVAAVAEAIASICCHVTTAATSDEKRNNLTVTTLDFDTMLSNPQYDEWFRSNLRCSRQTFHELCSLLLIEMDDFASTFIMHSFQKKVGIFLYYLGSQGGYREVEAVFGVSKSWAVETVAVVMDVVAGMSKRYICWPKDAEDWDRVELGFYSKHGVPGVVGAIDGSIFSIKRPVDFEGFYCRKGFPALNVQSVVDSDGRFLSIDVGPGSWSDKKIWRFSRLGRTAKRLLPYGTHLIGDAGYSLLPWLLTPYVATDATSDDNFSKLQRQFNFWHSSTRMVVECAFGRLKGRFRTLNVVLSEQTITKAAKVVAVCMTMHNILIALQDDTIIIPTGIDMERRIELDAIAEPNTVLRSSAMKKRDSIARLLFEKHST
jgi:DDE superfamily endonuclease